MIIVGLVGGGYITIFYDIFKHLLEKYVSHSSNPDFDPTIGIDGVAGFLAIVVGIVVVFALKREKNKSDNTPHSNPES